MASANEWDDRIIALAPLRWNIVKIERGWEGRIALLDTEAGEETSKLEVKHREQRRVLVQRLKATREATKATIPLNGRLQTMRDSRDNLQRLGRAEEANKVRRKLEPLEKAFWSKAMAEAGITARAKRERDALLARQQAELGSLRGVLRRDTEGARKARDAEIKAQKRSSRYSSDDIWSIWFAARTGENSRLSQLLASPEASVDQRDPDSGWTALHFAARQGRFRAIEVLLGRKASVGAKAPDGRTALHFAAGWGTYEVCLALLHAGADKHVVDRDGSTPLQLAESKRRHKIASVLHKWRPIGLTATQTQGIIDSSEDGPPRPWELEKDQEIRAQLRVLDMKRTTFGDRHQGARITLGKLAEMCRSAGRLEDCRQHLEQLLQLLQLLQSPTKGNTVTTSPRDLVGLAVVLGNLGVVCHEIGDDDRARELLERSLETITSGNTGSERTGHIIEAVARNLGLHYFSGGRIEEARSLFRKSLEFRENDLRPDMPGGDESLGTIKPLVLLSYADMLAGDHVAAAVGAERVRSIADARYKYGIRYGSQNSPLGNDASKLSSSSVVAEKEYQLADPVPRLEWLGVQRFMAGKLAESAEFFSRGRALVIHREETARERRNNLEGQQDRRCGDCFDQITTDAKCGRATVDVVGEAPVKTGMSKGEFHPEAMRLDQCAAVAICRKGPEAF